MRQCAAQVHGDDMHADMRGGVGVGVGRFFKSGRSAPTGRALDGDREGDEDEEREGVRDCSGARA